MPWSDHFLRYCPASIGLLTNPNIDVINGRSLCKIPNMGLSENPENGLQSKHKLKSKYVQKLHKSNA